MFGLKKRIAGYCLCMVESAQVHRFINICRNKHIYLWNVSVQEGRLAFYALKTDIEALNPILEKCGGSLTVQKEYGLPIILKRMLRHKYFYIGILLGALLIVYMSRFIWNVEITGNSYYTDETLNSFLNELGAGCGAKKKSVTPSSVEEEMRLRYNNISWVSVQIVGTKLMVTLEEGSPKEAPLKEVKKNMTADIGGVVTSIVTRSGTPLVHIGDTVEEGALLVEGKVDIIGDDMAVKETKETNADADITLKSEIEIEKLFKRHYKRKAYTGREVSGYTVNLLNYQIPVNSRACDFENYEIISDFTKYRLTENFYIPASVEKRTFREYIWEDARYDDAAIQEIAEAAFQDYLKKIEEAGITVLESHAEAALTEDGCTISGSVTVNIPVGKAHNLVWQT